MNERFDPTHPQTWLARARSNLRLASVGRQQAVFLQDLCSEARQAAETALKSLWVRYGLDIPGIHSLVILLDGLELTALRARQRSRQLTCWHNVQSRPASPTGASRQPKQSTLRCSSWLGLSSRGLNPHWKEVAGDRISYHCRTT
jgi:hypothetical protein